MSYPESFALALTVLALLAGISTTAGCLAARSSAIAVLARPEAIALVVPLGWIAWTHRERLDPGRRGWALAAVLAGKPASPRPTRLYLKWAINDANAWRQSQKLWGRAFDIAGPLRAFVHFPGKVGGEPVLGRDLGFLIIYALLLYVAARRGVDRAWILGGVLVLALPLFSGSVESEARFGLLALPVYWGAGLLFQSRRAQLALQLGSLAILVAWVIALPDYWP